MELKEVKEKSKKMLANFIDEIGLDGDSYTSTCNCPMAWGEPKLCGCGEFIAPESERLQEILQSAKYDEKTKRVLNQRGLILINRDYRKQEADINLFVTAIHETIHSNRNLLLFDATRDSRNENAYIFNNGKFDQNTTEYDFSYADASQEVLKGNNDTSKETVDSYKGMSSEELEDMQFIEGKRDSKMEKQQIIDEALVELMSVLSYKLYSNKEKNEPTDIWKVIEETRDFFKGEDIGVMCEIILKHHDFELFNWMIDPIAYSEGDIHYDFFEEYTKYDQELVQELYESAGIDIEELLGDIVTNQINKNDMKKVATSQTAIEELESSLRDIRNAQNRDDIENEKQ